MTDVGAGDPSDVPGTADAATPATTSPASGLRRASALLAAGTLVSRVLGFFSAAILAWVLGTQNAGANAFAVANGLPNSIYAIVAAGVLSAVLVPQIVRAGRDPDGGQDFVNRLLTLGICVFLAATVLTTLLAAPVTTLFTLGQTNALSDDGFALAVAFAVWCLPQIFFYALYSLLGEVFNARGVFGPFTWAPALNNVVVVIGLLVFAALFGVDPAHRDPATWDAAQIAVLGGGATLGIAAQALVLVVFWRRTGFTFRPDFHWRGTGLGGTLRAAAWTLSAVLLTQAAGAVQTAVALSADETDPSTFALRNAWLIFMLPHGIIAVSIATPYFTRLARHASGGDLAAVRADLSSSLRVIGLLITAACVALAAAAIPFAAVFAKTEHEIAGLASVLLAFLLGLVPFSALFVIQRGFYALGDTRTPFLTQVVQVVVFVTGAGLVALAATDPATSPIVGVLLALATTTAGTVQTIVAALVLRRRLGGTGGATLVRHFGLYAVATIPAGAAGLGMLWLLGGLPVTAGGFATAGPVPGILSVLAVSAAAGIVYLGVLALARIPEVRELSGIIRRIVRR